MNQTEYENLCAKIDSYLEKEPLGKAELAELRSQYEKCAESPGPDAQYLAGYILYQYGAQISSVEECVGHFTQVLRSHPDDGRALWYLACHYNDTERWQKSLRMMEAYEASGGLERTHEKCLKTGFMGPYFKAKELLLSLRLRQDPQSNMKEVEKLIDLYHSSPAENVFLPSELYLTLRDLLFMLPKSSPHHQSLSCALERVEAIMPG